MSKPIFSDGIGYEGRVTLTLKSNNRVLKSETYKNNGTARLFQFLGLCLIDSYEEAKKYLPGKLLLLKNNSTGNVLDAKSVSVCSTWQTLVKTPAIISDGETSQVKVIYSFEIPRAAVTARFNQVALYGVNTNDIYDFSAYYYLTDALGQLKEESVEEWSATTILLIEWELSISNKNVSTREEQV